MRSRLIISIFLLTVVIACGVMNVRLTRSISDRYISAAEELRTMTQSGAWERAAQTAQVYHDQWKETLSWLQMLINHSDGDEVTCALVRLQAGIACRELPACLQACAELREAAEHIYHRDAFTWGNVL